MVDKFEQLKTLLKWSEPKKRFIFNKKILNFLGISPQDAYDYLHPDRIKHCPICGIKTKFRNFSLGYSEACAKHKDQVAHQRSLDATEKIYGTRDPLSINNGRSRGIYKCNHDPSIAAKREQTCVAKYGTRNTFSNSEFQEQCQIAKAAKFSDPEFRSNVIAKVKESHINHYGMFYTQTKEYKDRHKETRRQRRILAEAGKEISFKRYRRLVDMFTKELDISKLQHSCKRGLSGTPGAYQLDHMYSVKDGWLNDIPAHIVGSIANVKFIPWEDNLRKSAKSSITKEELLERYQCYAKNQNYSTGFDRSAI